MALVLIFCCGGNIKFQAIAGAAGFAYGARLPSTLYGPLTFADQDWRRPNRIAYMAALAMHRPRFATVMDWEQADQLSIVLDWAEEAAQYAERVIIIPKVIGGIERLPRRIGTADIVLGLSVPTRFSGTNVPLWEFAGWPIHLLGGSPQKQQACWSHLAPIAEVVSVDGNYAQKMAIKHGQYWVPGTARWANNRWWPTLREAGMDTTTDMPCVAFGRSCTAIMAAWRERTTVADVLDRASRQGVEG